MKRIVICCDGTWNSPDESKEGVPCPTNVVKLAGAVRSESKDKIDQLMYYDPGVGTSGSIVQRWFDGATGSGISRNILDAYRYLIANYEIGDQLYFLGFSRGAFTVRSLAGLIRNSGILKYDSLQLVNRAYELYKSRRSSTHPKEREATLFRRTYAVADIFPIKFIGVWDTVGALGNPLLLNTVFSKLSISILSNRFHDTDLSSHVENAFQALAIDEKRSSFRPTLWSKQAGAENQTLEQVWFIGVHSNVGGGYVSSAISDIALDWLASKARECGLDIASMITAPDDLIPPEESRKGFYKLVPKYYRPIRAKGNGDERLHESVIDHCKRVPSYRPRNLEDFFRRFPSERPK